MIILVMIRQTKQIHPNHGFAIFHPYVSKHYSDLLFDFIDNIFCIYTNGCNSNECKKKINN